MYNSLLGRLGGPNAVVHDELSSFVDFPAAAFSFCAFSCSIICLLQLWDEKLARVEVSAESGPGDILSAGEEAVRLGHLVSVLELGAQLPDSRCDAKDNRPRNRRVFLPVGRLRIPTTGRRPDMLGITTCRVGRLGEMMR